MSEEKNEIHELIESKWDMEFQLEDIRAELESLRAQEIKLSVMLDRDARNLEETYNIQSKITEIRYEIREKRGEILSLKSRLRKIKTALKRRDRIAEKKFQARKAENEADMKKMYEAYESGI